MDTTGSETRKSARKRTPNKKYLQSTYHPTSSRRSRAPETLSSNSPSEMDDNSENSSGNDNSLIEIDLSAQQNKGIFYNAHTDVAGNQIYGFSTPKKASNMKALAANTPKTPITALKSLSLNQAANSPGTPKSHKKPSNTVAKTPYNVRSKNKSAIRKKTQESEDDDDDFSSNDDSDYEGNESESNSTESEEDSSQEDEESPPQKPIKLTIKKILEPVQATSLRPGLRSRMKAPVQETDFIPNSDDYFVTISSKKNKTSDNTLDQLKSSRLHYQELFSILKSIRLSDEHQKRIIEMNKNLEEYFDTWMLDMSQGYNIIIYGVGSKQMLLHKFCERHMADRPVMIINGFFPTITMKEILQLIKSDMLEVNTTTHNEHEIVDLIAATLNGLDDCHLFLIVNNIDGPMLRKTKDQHALSRLAKIKNVHLIASIDHINAPLMWDQTCMNNYNFVWYDCTTMLPYENETAFENSVFLQNSSDMDLAAMNNVFQSLTTNARGIYKILVDAEITNQKDSNYSGMPFTELYRKCREGFLVCSDSALRTQLIEFVDHNMAKLKRSNDGTEHVSIPISPKILKLFNEQQSG